jgi:hypothetical protein
MIVQNFYEFDVTSFFDSVIIEEPFLGHINIQENMLSKIVCLCSNLQKSENEFVIFTFSDQMWKDLSKDFTLRLSEVGAVLHEFCLNYEMLTGEDQVEILRSKFLLYNPQSPFVEVEAVASKFDPVHVAYAETCTLLSRCKNFQTNPGPVKFCNGPLSSLKSHFENMCKSSAMSEKGRFLVLVFMSLIQRKVDKKGWTKLHELCKFFKSCNLSTKIVPSMMPKEFVVEEEKSTYVLDDDVIQRMVLIVFGTHHFEKLLRFHRWLTLPEWIKETRRFPSHLMQHDIDPVLYLRNDKLEELENSCTAQRAVQQL